MQTELPSSGSVFHQTAAPKPLPFENSAPDVELLTDLSDQISLLSPRLSPRNSSKQLWPPPWPQPEMRPHHPVSVPQRPSFSGQVFHTRPRLQAGRQTARGLRLGFSSKAGFSGRGWGSLPQALQAAPAAGCGGGTGAARLVAAGSSFHGRATAGWGGAMTSGPASRGRAGRRPPGDI